MLYKQPKLDEIVDDVRAMGDMLIPYNFPKVKPPIGEDDLAFFKERECLIDGYPVVLHYHKSDYDKHLMETLQVYGKNSPFLPFCVVVKLGKAFLGPHHLSLVELFKDNRKIYCWSLCVDRRGRPIPSPYDVQTEQCHYEGFDYLYLQPNQVNFF
jgi:hypothetical protein